MFASLYLELEKCASHADVIGGHVAFTAHHPVCLPSRWSEAPRSGSEFVLNPLDAYVPKYEWQKGRNVRTKRRYDRRILVQGEGSG